MCVRAKLGRNSAIIEYHRHDRATKALTSKTPGDLRENQLISLLTGFLEHSLIGLKALIS